MIRHVDERVEESENGPGNGAGAGDTGSGGDNNSFDEDEDDLANLMTSPNINATQHYSNHHSMVPHPPPPPLSPPPSNDEFNEQLDQMDQSSNRKSLTTTKQNISTSSGSDSSNSADRQKYRSESLFGGTKNKMENQKRQSFPNISTTDINNRNSSVINSTINNSNDNNKNNNNRNKQTLGISSKAFSTGHNSHEQPNAAILRKHLEKIESLEVELERVKSERDSLLTENEHLCFQLQVMSEAVKSQQTQQSQPTRRESSSFFDGQNRLKGPTSHQNYPIPNTLPHPHSQQQQQQPVSQPNCQCPSTTTTTSNVNQTLKSSTSVGMFPATTPVNGNIGNGGVSSIRQCSSCHQLVAISINGGNDSGNLTSPTSNGQSRPNEPSPDNLAKYNSSLKSPISSSSPGGDELPHHPHLQNHYLIHHGEQRVTNSPQPPQQLPHMATLQGNNVNSNQAVCHTSSLPTPTSGHPHHKGLLQRSSALSSESAIQPLYPNTEMSSPAGGVLLSPSSPNGKTSEHSLNLSASLNLSPTTATSPNMFGSAHPMSSSSNLVRSARATGGSSNSLASASNAPYNGYEISQQLLDKQVSALERKYGGSMARDAAIKLQRAFRSYRLQKRFTCLAIQAINHQQLKQQQRQTDFMSDLVCQTDGNQSQAEPSSVTLETLASINNHTNNSNSSTNKQPTAIQTPSVNVVSQSVESQNTIQANSSTKLLDSKICYLPPQPALQSRPQFPTLATTTHATLVNHYEPVYQLPPSILYSSSLSNHYSNNSNNNNNSNDRHQPHSDSNKALQKKTSFSSTSSTASSSSLHAISSSSSKPSEGASSSAKTKEYSDPLQQQFGRVHPQPTPLQQQMYKQKLSKQQLQNNANNRSATMSPSVSHHGHSSSSLVSQSINPVAVSFAPGVEYVSTIQAAAAPSDAATAIGTNALENYRKRRYRVGLNLFNKNPSERGIRFLITNNFIEQSTILENQAKYVSRFLLTRKGLSRQMIGEYISEKIPFNQAVLKGFSSDIDFTGIIVDEALRKFQMNFRFPGEAQKIERLVENFADRYKECNPSDVLSRDSIFILAFAIIMLNTDLHKPTNNKHRMTPDQWLNNLKGVFSEGDLSSPFLLGIYKRIKKQELQTGADHVTQVLKVQSTIVGKDVPNLCLPHRRLVCYCRLYEIREISRREKVGQHQRDVFLFNDLLLITKTTTRSRNGTLAEYQYRSSHSLDGLHVVVFNNVYYAYGIQISRRVDNKQIACFNARNDLDQQRFVDDLQESIAEMDEMEQLRITKSSSLVHLNSFANVDQQSTQTHQPPSQQPPSPAASTPGSANATMHDQNVSMSSVITSSQTDVATCFSSLSSIATQPPPLQLPLTSNGNYYTSGGGTNLNPNFNQIPYPDSNNHLLHQQHHQQLHYHHNQIPVQHYGPQHVHYAGEIGGSSCPVSIISTPNPNSGNNNGHHHHQHHHQLSSIPNSSTGDLSNRAPLNS